MTGFEPHPNLVFGDSNRIFEFVKGPIVSESKEEKRARLIEVAIAVLGRQGIRKTNLDDIAKAAGVATTSLYYYFPNKNELVRAALSSMVDTLLAEVEAVVHSSLDPEAKLIGSWKTLFSNTKRSGLLTNLDAMAKSEVLHLTEDLVENANHRFTVLIQEVLEEGQATGVFQVKDMETTAMVLSVGVLGLLVNTAGKAQFDLIERQIQEFGNLVMNGLKKR